MHGAPDDQPLQPITGTVVFALVAAPVQPGVAPSFDAAGIAAQRQLLSRAAALVAPPEGRVVELQGDGLLLLFTLPDAALAWAHSAQALMSPHQTTAPTPQALALRLGLHHGQVLSDGTALYGHGVNLAARIANVAGLGETLLSDVTQRHASPSWQRQMDDLGPYFLKHFDEPQQLYKLNPSPALMRATA
ncbi:MAG: hypothetical protein C4K60_00170 [Ideonella sp. MAG2]|nr:MAG: hypothetical protein C4K60_00170 [Ideonella sp. MAG2]